MLRTVNTTPSSAARLWRSAGFAVAAVLAASFLLRAVAFTSFDISSSFVPLQAGPLFGWTLAIVALLALVRTRVELTGRSASGFRHTAILFLGVLVALDALVLLAGIVPGVNVAAILTLLTTQVSSFMLCLYLFGSI